MDTSRALVMLAIAALASATSGCTKKDESKTDPAGATTTAASGCGADYADPQKEFCVKVPAEYTPEPQKADSLYSERIDFNGPMSGFTISVGTGSYEDRLKRSQEDMKDKDVTVESTGTNAGTGTWWIYKKKGYDSDVQAVVKSNAGKALRCTANNSVVKPEVMAACKTLRAYPK